jgi:hypothetical protein
MYVELYERQNCPTPEQVFFRCGSTGFTGCCSVNPCTSGCPDGGSQPLPGTTAAPRSSVSMGFSTIVAPTATGLPPPQQTTILITSSVLDASATASAIPAGGSPIPDPLEASNEGISKAAVGGIVAAIIVFIQVIIVCVFLYWRRGRKLRKSMQVAGRRTASPSKSKDRSMDSRSSGEATPTRLFIDTRMRKNSEGSKSQSTVSTETPGNERRVAAFPFDGL